MTRCAGEESSRQIGEDGTLAVRDPGSGDSLRQAKDNSQPAFSSGEGAALSCLTCQVVGRKAPTIIYDAIQEFHLSSVWLFMGVAATECKQSSGERQIFGPKGVVQEPKSAERLSSDVTELDALLRLFVGWTYFAVFSRVFVFSATCYFPLASRAFLTQRKP